MSDTVSACYDDYYTASEKEICENDCYTAYDQAWGWVKQRVKEGKEWKDQMAGGPSGSQSNGTDWERQMADESAYGQEDFIAHL